MALPEAGWFLVGSVLGLGFVGAVPDWLALTVGLALGSAAAWGGWRAQLSH